MGLTAVQSAGDAIDVTREYLFGRSLRQGILLAFMTLFLGPTGMTAPPGPFEIDEQAFEPDDELPSLSELLDAIDWELAATLLGLLVLLAVLYGLVSAFMEFGFVHSLVTNTVAIREPAGSHWPRALALFLFRAVVWGSVVALGGLFIADAFGVVDPPVALDWSGLAPVLLLVGAVVYLVNRFTTDFVVPIMYHERRGFLSSWARLLGVVRAEWRQFAVYVPVRVILELALGIAFGIVIAIGLIALAIILGVPVGVVAVLLLGPVAGLAVTVGLLAIVAIGVVAAAMVPFHTYLRYYTLLVLGDTAQALDLVAAERRRARS